MKDKTFRRIALFSVSTGMVNLGATGGGAAVAMFVLGTCAQRNADAKLSASSASVLYPVKRDGGVELGDCRCAIQPARRTAGDK